MPTYRVNRLYDDVKLKHFYKMTNKLGGFEGYCDGLFLYP